MVSLGVVTGVCENGNSFAGVCCIANCAQSSQVQKLLSFSVRVGREFAGSEGDDLAVSRSVHPGVSKIASERMNQLSGINRDREGGE